MQVSLEYRTFEYNSKYPHSRIKRVFIQRLDTDKLNTESQVLYRVKNILNTMLYPHQFIKKLAYKDGHMISDTTYYLRSKNIHKQDSMMIYDEKHQIRNIKDDYNEGLTVVLEVEYFDDRTQPIT